MKSNFLRILTKFYGQKMSSSFFILYTSNETKTREKMLKLHFQFKFPNLDVIVKRTQTRIYVFICLWMMAKPPLHALFASNEKKRIETRFHCLCNGLK